MAVSKRLRYEVLRRDNHACRYCGAKAPEVALEVDHVVARALGGTDEPGNLVTACSDCNAGKSSTPADAELVEDVNQDALRWRDAVRKAAELQRRQRDEIAEQVDEMNTAWVIEWFPVQVVASYEPERGWRYNKDPEREYPVIMRMHDTETGETWTGELFDTLDECEKKIRELVLRNVPPRPKDWEATARQWLRAGLSRVDFEAIVSEVVTDRGYVSWDRKWAYTVGVCWGVIRERQSIAQALLVAEEEPQGRTM